METPIAATSENVAKRRFLRIEWLLLLAGQCLFFQAFPVAWTRLLDLIQCVSVAIWSVLDVRNWNIVGDIAGLTVVLVVLVALKAWKDRRDWTADFNRWSSRHAKRDRRKT